MTIEELDLRVKRLEASSKQETPKDIQDILTRLFFDEQIIKTVSVVPSATFIPSKFRDQFVIFNDGVNKKLYVYVNGTGWLPITL